MQTAPLVSVITPVFNGELYLAECIESVLKQTYQNFEYIIVNNCSTDRTLEIASNYAKKDGRIQIFSNEKTIEVIANHNLAFKLISHESKYCKVVSADDWLFPESIERLTTLAEQNPSVGMVNSYQLRGAGPNGAQWSVVCDHIPYPSTVVSGREICRFHLLGGPYTFGSPTSLLYRADLIKEQESFYPTQLPEADTSACYKYLQNTNFGFVHQVLSYERIHENRISTYAKLFNTYIPSKISDLLIYGQFYLTDQEIKSRLSELLEEYYDFIASLIFNFKSHELVQFHKKQLIELGFPLDYFKLIRTLSFKLIDLFLNPKSSIEKMMTRFNQHNHSITVPFKIEICNSTDI